MQISTKTFYSAGDPYVAVQRYYHQNHCVPAAPSRGAIQRSEDTGNVSDKRRKLRVCVRTEDVGYDFVKKYRELLEENPSVSDINISTSTVILTGKMSRVCDSENPRLTCI
jgi:hypothetical protein